MDIFDELNILFVSFFPQIKNTNNGKIVNKAQLLGLVWLGAGGRDLDYWWSDLMDMVVINTRVTPSWIE